jgi:uroporphyrinogen-III decarboxylase
MVSAPEIKDILKKILDLAEAHERHREEAFRYVSEMSRLGFPMPWATAQITAFDCVSDTLRGMKGSMLDMYRVPDKLLATIEMFTPQVIEVSVMMAARAQNKGIMIPLHRGAAGFMSDEQFAKFYWPCLKALLLGLIDAGLTPIPFFEGNYTPRLEYLTELPPGKVVGHFDQVDRKKARKLLGNVMCFWDNVPASMICA